MQKILLIKKKLKPTLITLKFSSMKRTLHVFLIGQIPLWWSKPSPHVKVVQSECDTTFVKKSAFDTIKYNIKRKKNLIILDGVAKK